jgi:hypothetical protein
VVQVGHQQQVLLAGEQVVDRGELAGDADRGAHRVGSVATSWPATRTSPPSADQRGQDLHRGGLAGAVRAEQGEDRARGDVRSMPSSTTLSPKDLRRTPDAW